MPSSVSLAADLRRDDSQSAIASREAAAFMLRLRKAAKSSLARRTSNGATWNILLALYSAQDTRRGLHIESVTKRAHVPRTTTLRALLNLQRLGYASLAGDPEDRRAVIVKITPRGVEAMDRCFTAARFIT